MDINIGGQGDQFNMQEAAFQPQLGDGSFWKKLLAWHKQGYLLGAGTPEEEAGGPGDEKDRAVIAGIVQGHAYGILDVQEVRDLRLVKLRSPPHGPVALCRHR